MHDEINTPRKEPVQEKFNHSFDVLRMSKQKDVTDNKWIRSINSTLGLNNRNKIVYGGLNQRVISSLERMPGFRKKALGGGNSQRHMFIHNDNEEVVYDRASP